MKDNIQAFPFEEINERLDGKPHKWTNHKGMTIRDYFAGQALMGFLIGEWNMFDDKEVAEKSYEMADIMLKERLKVVKYEDRTNRRKGFYSGYSGSKIVEAE